MDFKPGEVVQLKSGGPLMTVESVGEKGTLTCIWFVGFSTDTAEPRRNFFQPSNLKRPGP